MGVKMGLVYDLRSDYLAEGYGVEDVGEMDSEETIAALEGALRSLGHQVERIGHGRALVRRLADGDRWDLVFNIAEGLSERGREAQVPAVLEMFGIGYTFSDPLVCAATLDKGITKRWVRTLGLPTAKFRVVRDTGALRGIDLDFPLFVKPVAEGTGKGIDSRSRVESAGELSDACARLLKRYNQPVLVEEYLPGREFTVGLLGTGSDARALGAMEIEVLDHEANSIYSFDVKEQSENKVRYTPLRTGALRRTLEELALKAYRGLECRDAARVDFRADRKGEPVFIEINVLPGLHPTHSDLPMIATSAGMSYSELIGGIVGSALNRLGGQQ